MMKRRNFLFAAAPLAASPFAAPRLGASAAKQSAEAISYHFEPEPSAPLAHYGAPTRDGKLALRASGAVYLLAVSGGHGGSSLGMATSGDGGDSFSPPVAISPDGAAVSSHGENSPTFGFSPGIEAYALWERNAGGALGTELLLSRSPAFGHSWEAPVRVTDKAEPSTNAFSSLGIRRAAGLCRLAGRPGPRQVPARNILGLFGQARRRRQVRSAQRGRGPWGMPLLPADDHVRRRRQGPRLVAQVFPGSIRDIGVATSLDGGKTFSEPVRVAADNWKIDGCPHSGASMVVKDDRLWISWYSDGDGTNSGVRLTYSDDGGQSFAPARVISGDILDANHPDLTVADDGRVLLSSREPRARRTVGRRQARGSWKPWAPARRLGRCACAARSSTSRTRASPAVRWAACS